MKSHTGTFTVSFCRTDEVHISSNAQQATRKPSGSLRSSRVLRIISTLSTPGLSEFLRFYLHPKTFPPSKRHQTGKHLLNSAPLPRAAPRFAPKTTSQRTPSPRIRTKFAAPKHCTLTISVGPFGSTALYARISHSSVLFYKSFVNSCPPQQMFSVTN